MSYVYFILNKKTRAVKIGYSKSPERRILQLQTGCSSEHELLGYLPGSKKLESTIHDLLDEWCSGGEWFDHTSHSVRSFIASATALGVSAAIGEARRWAIIREERRARERPKQILVEKPPREIRGPGELALIMYDIMRARVPFHKCVAAAFGGWWNLKKENKKYPRDIQSGNKIYDIEIAEYDDGKSAAVLIDGPYEFVDIMGPKVEQGSCFITYIPSPWKCLRAVSR